MELRQYFNVVRKWLWLIILTTAVGAAGAYLTSRSMPKIYKTQTTVMVGQSIQSINPDTGELSASGQLALTYAEIVTRQPILQATIEALGLDMSVGELREKVGVALVHNTQLLEISVEDVNPLRARAIADEIANQLVQQSPTAIYQQEQDEYRQFVRFQLRDLELKIQDAQREIADLEARTSSLETEELTEDQARLRVLQERLDTWQATYASLLSFIQDTPANYISVVEPAPVPTAPIGPRTQLNVLLAAITGLTLALGMAFFLEYLDDTIKTPEDIEQTMGLSTLGAITRIKGKHLEDKLIAADHPKSPISEAYRVLRTNIQFSAIDQPMRTLLVTSPNPIEGKSTTLANLGVVMAQAGLSVIAVDSDLRRPVLHKFFKLPRKEGLTNALLQDEPAIDGYLQATEVDNLRVLASGPLPPNPSELLSSQKMRRLLENLTGQADVVLLDSPPMLVVTDAAVLANQVDGVLIVAEAGKTRRGMAQRAMENLGKVGANLVGAVLNRLSQRAAGDYYYYYYYYSEDGGEERRKRKRSKE